MTELMQRVIDTLNGYDFECLSYYEIESICDKLHCEYGSGATRWALIFPEHQIVFKFQRCAETRTNYCEIEYANYQKAIEYRVEKILLPIELVGTLKSGHRIYCQPMYSYSHYQMPDDRRIGMEKKIKTVLQSSIVHKVSCGCYYAPNREWLARAIQIYGKKFMRSFEKWSMECNVNDLHTENCGFLRNQPVIIDYAGFHG